MFRLTIFIFLTLSTQIAASQNIFSALHLNEDREYKTAKPKKIVETNTFFNSRGKQVDRNIKTFDAAGMLLTEERYDESGKLKAKLVYTNDTANKLKLTRTIERWTNIGYSKYTAYYTYDVNNFLVGTTDKDATGNVITETKLICNERGHPVELLIFDGKGNSFGKEVATYFYDKNRVATAVISNDGRILSSDTIKISFKEVGSFASDKEVYNLNGDLVIWSRRNLDNTETIFEGVYSYDEFGNCTESRIYEITVKANGKRKKERDRIFKREYSY